MTRFQELIESTECEVVITICGTHKPTFEIIRPEDDTLLGWTLHINPDGNEAEDFDFDSLDEAGDAMMKILWARNW